MAALVVIVSMVVALLALRPLLFSVTVVGFGVIFPGTMAEFKSFLDLSHVENWQLGLMMGWAATMFSPGTPSTPARKEKDDAESHPLRDLVRGRQ